MQSMSLPNHESDAPENGQPIRMRYAVALKGKGTVAHEVVEYKTYSELTRAEIPAEIRAKYLVDAAFVGDCENIPEIISRLKDKLGPPHKPDAFIRHIHNPHSPYFSNYYTMVPLGTLIPSKETRKDIQ